VTSYFLFKNDYFFAIFILQLCNGTLTIHNNSLVTEDEQVSFVLQTTFKKWHSALASGPKGFFFEWICGNIKFGPGSFLSFLKFMSNVDSSEN